MAHQHIVAVLNEANKKISQIIDQIEHSSSNEDFQHWIDDINTIIRQLDHVVESLEKK